MLFLVLFYSTGEEAMEKECVFCDRKNFSENLIGEDKNFHVFATLGQITDGGYVLIAPKRHVRCIGEIDLKEAAALLEISHYLRGKIKDVYSSESTMFEHGIVGQTVSHAHLHVIPAVIDFSQKIGSDFPTCETNAIISLRDLPRAYALSKEPYLFWQMPWHAPMVCWNPPAPPQYLRILAAEAVGHPERGNWRKMDPELDKKFRADTVAKLKLHFA